MLTPSLDASPKEDKISQCDSFATSAASKTHLGKREQTTKSERKACLSVSIRIHEMKLGSKSYLQSAEDNQSYPLRNANDSASGLRHENEDELRNAASLKKNKE